VDGGVRQHGGLGSVVREYVVWESVQLDLQNEDDWRMLQLLKAKQSIRCQWEDEEAEG